MDYELNLLIQKNKKNKTKKLKQNNSIQSFVLLIFQLQKQKRKMKKVIQ